MLISVIYQKRERMGPKHCKIFYFPTGSPTTIEDKTFNFKPRGNFISVVDKVHIF